ncbi:MAG: cytochrome P450 [Ilumatobacteraceae bacterium]
MAAPVGPTIDDLIHREQAAIACPYPIFQELRHRAGLTFNGELGAWIVTRYDDIRSILRDTDRFSSLNPTGPEAAGEALMKGMMELMQDASMGESFSRMSRGRVAVLLNADPPDHRRQRRLVNPAFRPDRIRAFEPAIIAITDRLLAEVREDLAAGRSVDIVHRFAVGVPMTIIAMALGVADDDLLRFKRWSDDIVMPVGNHSPSLEQIRGFVHSTREFTDYFLAEIAERKRQPREDLLSDIANAEIDGEALTDDEQLGMLQQFLVAGNETTTTLITNMIRHLAEDADLQRRVRGNPEAVETLVEEMLRLEAPVGGLFRQAKVDVEIGGSTVKAGDHLWLVFASANRDECKFAEPDRVVLDRGNVKEHLAFGNGEHFCPGAGLARTEARIAIARLLEQFDDIRLDSANDFPFGDSFVLRGLTRLSITATPRF